MPTTRCWRPCTPTRTGSTTGSRWPSRAGTARSPRPDGGGYTLHVEDLHVADTTSAAGLWRFLLGVDLIAHVEAAVPVDDPLDLLLADPRDAVVTGLADETWLRLVDVPAALTARSFRADVAPLLLAVHDPLLPDNAGVYRIAGEGAERVGPLGACEPELSCDVAALAAAYLGDRSPSTLAATGWWTVHDPTAPARADALFTTTPAPWCGTHF